MKWSKIELKFNDDVIGLTFLSMQARQSDFVRMALLLLIPFIGHKVKEGDRDSIRHGFYILLSWMRAPLHSNKLVRRSIFVQFSQFSEARHLLHLQAYEDSFAWIVSIGIWFLSLDISFFCAAPHLNLEPKRIHSDNKSILSSTSRERQIESESDERDRAPRLSVRLLNRITTKAKIRQCIRACRHTEHTRDIVNAVHKVKRPWQGWKCLLTTERREEGKMSKANNNTGKAAEKWDRIWVTVATFLSVVSFLSVSFLFGLWLHMLCSYSMADFEQRQ